MASLNPTREKREIHPPDADSARRDDYFDSEVFDRTAQSRPVVGVSEHVPSTDLERSFRRLATITASVALFISASTLIGWLAGAGSSVMPIFGRSPMRVNTAVSLTMISTAILIVQIVLIREIRATAPPSREEVTKRLRVVAIALSAAAGLLGLLTLAQYVLGADFGIDQLLARESRPRIGIEFPGRPSELSAALIITSALATALTLTRSQRFVMLRQLLAISTAVLALVVMLSHIYKSNVFFDVQMRSATAFTTAIALVLVGTSILCLTPREGLMRIVSGPGAGGAVARRLLPLVFVGVPALGFLHLLGEHSGAFDEQFGIALFAIATVVMLATAILWVATQMERHERIRLRLEADRNRAKALLNGLVENSASSIGMDDLESRFVIVNQAFEELYGVKRDDVLGRRADEFFPRDKAEDVASRHQRVCATGETMYEEVTVGDGEDARVNLLQVFPVTDTSGELLGVGSVATDITHQREQERLLLRANERLKHETERAQEAIAELESFAHTVSHDLRSPLRAIDGFSQILEAEYDESFDDRGRHYMEAIREGVREMGELIDGLLAFSRIGRADLELSELDMTALAIRANDQLASERDGRDVRVKIDPLPAAEGDQRLISAVFMNLLSNAHKYTRARDVAEIHVGIKRLKLGGSPVYFVRDNGVGFDMQYVDKLFGVFERLHRAEDYEGSGVGMATVQRIIRRHGGRIWAESEIDVGTTIFFQMNCDERCDD